MINIQNIDNNECFQWCFVRYVHSAHHNPARIIKADKKFAKGPNFEDMKFPFKVRDIHEVKKKKNSIGISIFGYENKVNYPIYVSKNCCKHKQVDLLLIGEEGKRHYLLIKGFKVFMYDYTLHQYITEGKIFVVVIYQLSEQQSY